MGLAKNNCNPSPFPNDKRCVCGVRSQDWTPNCYSGSSASVAANAAPFRLSGGLMPTHKKNATGVDMLDIVDANITNEGEHTVAGALLVTRANSSSFLAPAGGCMCPEKYPICQSDGWCGSRRKDDRWCYLCFGCGGQFGGSCGRSHLPPTPPPTPAPMRPPTYPPSNGGRCAFCITLDVLAKNNCNPSPFPNDNRCVCGVRSQDWTPNCYSGTSASVAVNASVVDVEGEEGAADDSVVEAEGEKGAAVARNSSVNAKDKEGNR